MPRSSKTKKTKSSKSSSKSSKSKPVEEVVEKVVEEAPVKRTRRVVNRESVLAAHDSLLVDLNNEIEEIRKTADKKKGKTGIRFLKNIVTRLKRLKADSARVIKQKKPSNRAKNSSSGFMKPVPISKEMCKFTGWEQDVPKSRVDVTKYICNYIKEHDLQNPADRRQIRPNSSLSMLLKMKKEEKEPLTYYSLQKKIQHHFK